MAALSTLSTALPDQGRFARIEKPFKAFLFAGQIGRTGGVTGGKTG
jgi:hypothetical protein